MELGKIIGQVVATIKAEQLTVGKLLLVKFIDEHGKPAGKTQVALDTIGAGEGEWVLVVRGSSARVSINNATPIDLTVVGIIDTVSSEAGILYQKNEAS
ncbi:MAG TPA: EutN/CcmL family microcompartment protein [bacterium]|nr:EutN/CcmL family microcompartment protein [bacterium]HNT65263.1 EutN/CcmL family microcompartment protein [bacterium]HOX86934.1 EutN/CcmL family microcompartment protein [bacterium]HPG46265.1 EutN/CcmL family microcompartment protein [bacterium]HPM98541.1 EutN/CcmL family microcompartment protein [bacterium]